jgi:hypothetical protein
VFPAMTESPCVAYDDTVAKASQVNARMHRTAVRGCGKDFSSEGEHGPQLRGNSRLEGAQVREASMSVGYLGWDRCFKQDVP